MAAIDKNGMVYTWGYGGSWMRGGGQLGNLNQALHHTLNQTLNQTLT